MKEMILLVGFYSRCKDCCKKSDNKRKDKTDKYKKKYADNNKEKRKNYYKDNREEILRKNREKCNTLEGKLKQKNNNLKRYNITLEQYNQMLIDQNHKCEICNEDEVNVKKLVVDHNHQTGQVRSLLCRNCNFLIGQAKENVDILKKAINYLENNNNINYNNVIILKGVK